MRALLLRLIEQNPSLESISTILTAFPESEVRPAGKTRPAAPKEISAQANLSLSEPLTPREIEILALLRSPLRIKEIASLLYISYSTAKRHTIHIYAKLGVNQRSEAVSRAEELNILLPR